MRHIPSGFVHYLRGLTGLWDDRPDAELLAAFTETGDQAAFTILVARHGPAVWATCRRMLPERADAEDAFQAAFIALARKAPTLRREPVAGWLARVARRASLDVRRASRRRASAHHRLCERVAVRSDDPPVDDELCGAVREELVKLPERFRTVLSLYYLEGKTQTDIGRILGVPQPTVFRRLQRGLDALREQLAKRGMVVTAAALVAVLGDVPVASALTPPSPRASAVADVILAPRFPAWAVVGAAMLLATGTAIALVAYPTSGPRTPPVTESIPQTPASVPAPQPVGAADRPTAALTGQVLGVDGRPVPHAEVTALARRPLMPGEHGLRDDIIAQGQCDADGRYALTVPADFATWYPDRHVTVLATAPGLAPQTVQVPLRGADATADVRLTRGALAGARLLDPQGRPAAGVNVRVVRIGDAAFEPIHGADVATPAGWPEPVTTGSDGRFVLTGVNPADNVWFQIDDDRYARQGGRIAPVTAGQTVTLGEVRWIEGRVFTANTSRPLAGARLTVLSGEETFPTEFTAPQAQRTATRVRHLNSVDVRTDADGHFRVRPAPGVSFELEIHPPEGSPHLAERRAIWLKPRFTGERFEMEKSDHQQNGVIVNGRLVEARTDMMDFYVGAEARFGLRTRRNPLSLAKN